MRGRHCNVALSAVQRGQSVRGLSTDREVSLMHQSQSVDFAVLGGKSQIRNAIRQLRAEMTACGARA
jgi:hypothetical protein